MGAGHSHSHAGGNTNERSLWLALGLTSTFLVIEVIAGIWSNSLALLSDAAHMFTDTTALAISLAAIRIGRRAADKRRTFGYYRFEILAAAFNALLLFGVAGYILVEAYARFKNPPEIASGTMLVVAVAGLVINLISMSLLAGGKEGSLNVKGAYLEVWSDMLGSVGVIIGALLIRWTTAQWIDSAIAVLIGLWVIPRTWILLKATVNILLEGVPDGIDMAEVTKEIKGVAGVDSLHDLHVWAVTSDKVSLSAHVVYNNQVSDPQAVLQHVRQALVEKFDIHHSTVQMERTPCEQARESDDHVFAESAKD